MSDKWPETPFEGYMLEEDVIIYCYNDALREELFQLLKERGIVWNGGTKIRDDDYRLTRAYNSFRVSNGKFLTKGNKKIYMEKAEYDHYMKCTFYGREALDADPIDESEWLAILKA